MADRRGTQCKKRRTREHVIADLAMNHVERHVLRSGFTMHRIVHDYGLDAAITTYSKRGEIENGVIWLQVKATDHPETVKTRPTLTVRVARKDLLYWRGEVYPVMLVLYDATADLAYWLSIQESLHGGRIFEMGKSEITTRIHLPLAQLLNEDAIHGFRQLKAEILNQW